MLQKAAKIPKILLVIYICSRQGASNAIYPNDSGTRPISTSREKKQ